MEQQIKKSVKVRNISLIILAMLLCVGVIIVANRQKREAQYAEAVDLFSRGEYAEAMALLEGMREYKNAQQMCDEMYVEYDKGVVAYMNGDYAVARDIFNRYAGFMEADKYIEEMNKIPNYSDEDVITAAFNAFKNKRRGGYQGAQSLYHGSDYSNANVSYDPNTRTYTCTLTCEYTTNIFDFWGTSTSTYYVTVQLLDNGSELSVINYSE